MEQETSYERLRSLFRIREGESIPDELKEWPATVLVSTLAGFLFGGMIGARWSGDKYMMMNHFTKYAHPMQAQRELHGAALLGFLRQGCKWGWKVGLFASIFSGCNILLSVYRNKDDGFNFVGAGGVTGTLFRVRYGVKPAIGGFTLGTLISIPVGLSYHCLRVLLLSKEEREQIRITKYQQRKKREIEWNSKLMMTGGIASSMESELEKPGVDSGLSNYYSLQKTKNDSIDNYENKRY